ncbi:Hypothetical predicted protein [Olea europaea subsp. europaea]|uniref:Uncharacterized protein n=1 Tax=Olea europaea subsp. europaea TaxID=158383 RepID=A0A8S0UIX2_OLEEU|nr:Hypothetical predicted protein [Olea europaea subsp. europaea]
MEGTIEVSDDDFDFIDSENQLEDEDDTLYDKNVTEGIEVGFEGQREVQDKQDLDNNTKVDNLKYPSKDELLLVCSSDDECVYCFPEFCAETDRRNPYFEVGQIFCSAVEFRETVKKYGAMNGYNVKFQVNEERRV